MHAWALQLCLSMVTAGGGMVLWLRRWNLEFDLGFKPGSAITSCIRSDKSLLWASPASYTTERCLKQSQYSVNGCYCCCYYYCTPTTPFTRATKTSEVRGRYWFGDKQSVLSPFYYQKREGVTCPPRTTPIHREKLNMLFPHATDRKNKVPWCSGSPCPMWVSSRVCPGPLSLCQCQSSFHREASTYGRRSTFLPCTGQKQSVYEKRPLGKHGSLSLHQCHTLGNYLQYR